jgi:hypothetical protein
MIIAVGRAPDMLPDRHGLPQLGIWMCTDAQHRRNRHGLGLDNATRREFLKQTSAAGLFAATAWHIARGAQTGAPTRASSPMRRTSGIVQTVLGPLDASKLGFTLTHEHICKNPSDRRGGRMNSVTNAVDAQGGA